MKKYIIPLLLLAVFLSGCGTNNTTTTNNSSQLNQPEEIKMVTYTSKNGVVKFEYPDKTYIPGEEKNGPVKVEVFEESDFIYVYPAQENNLPFITIASIKDIDQGQVDDFIQGVFRNDKCTATLTQDPNNLDIMSGQVNGELTDDPNKCNIVNMVVKYNKKKKAALIYNSAKSGDFFFDGNASDEVDDNSKSLQTKVFNSIQFAE